MPGLVAQLEAKREQDRTEALTRYRELLLMPEGDHAGRVPELEGLMNLLGLAGDDLEDDLRAIAAVRKYQGEIARLEGLRAGIRKELAGMESQESMKRAQAQIQVQRVRRADAEDAGGRLASGMGNADLELRRVRRAHPRLYD